MNQKYDETIGDCVTLEGNGETYLRIDLNGRLLFSDGMENSFLRALEKYDISPKEAHAMWEDFRQEVNDNLYELGER